MEFPRTLSANVSAIGKPNQRKVMASTIGVAGLGGVGGIAFELLVRAGVGRMKISDGGFFEESNANRQSLWSARTDGTMKSLAASEFAKGVNPAIGVLPHPKLGRENARKFAYGCAAVIDATDSTDARQAIMAGCKAADVPYIFASARKTRGMLTVFSRENAWRAAIIFGRKQEAGIPCDHALGPVANAIGCIAAQQAINAAIGKPLALFPKIISIDAFSSQMVCEHAF